MPDLWFFVGLAVGVIVMGFTAIGSFDRGADSVHRRAWSAELSARQRTVVASHVAVRAIAGPNAEGAIQTAS